MENFVVLVVCTALLAFVGIIGYAVVNDLEIKRERNEIVRTHC